jgi:hypothetical protein
MSLLAFVACVPLIAGVVALWFSYSRAARISAIAVVLLCASTTLGVLLASHRLAEEGARLDHQSPQNAEWWRGATDTRDVIYRVVPTLGTSFIVLAILAAIPPGVRSSPKRN